MSWVHAGDLHMDEADGWQRRERLDAIVAETNAHIGDAADFVFLPGDNANHAKPAQYQAMTRTLAPRRRPWHVIPGDRDFEPGDLASYEAAFPEANRPEMEAFAGYRCIFLDIVSTGQIEEGGGRPGFALMTIHGRVPSWRFKESGGAWPFVQIVAPADLRVVTRPADPQQVPRPGSVDIVARLFGEVTCPATVSIDDRPEVAMMQLPGTALWQATVSLDAGLHRVSVMCGQDRDTISLLVRSERDIPRRPLPVALGCDIHSVGPWPDHGIEGTRLGPNKNGRHW